MHLTALFMPNVGVPANAGRNKNRQIVGGDANKQLLRIMRLTAIILLSACLTASATGHTQGITLKLKNAPLEKVFSEIKKQTGYSFVYNNNLVATANKVDLQVNAATIEDVLDKCFKNQPLTYTIIDKTVIVKPKDGDLSPAGGGGRRPGVDNDAPPPIDITGRVTDADGNPLAGATVKVKGTNNGTTTNNDGVFVLKGVDEKATLEISFVGYETYTVAVNNRSSIIASLKVNDSPLNEMQVIAYGTTTKRFNTGNVATVKASDIATQPVNNPLLALQGRVPGMVITQVNGLPGGGVQVQIRGQNSIANGNLPLYIIDGVPFMNENLINLGSVLGSSSNAGDKGGNPLSFINPGDIESIDVLKDADATAIYGTRGANGVVLITTKKGKAGKIKLGVNVQSGFGKVAHMVDLLNTRQYLDMRYEAFKNDGTSIPASNYDLKLWDTTRYTDWQKVLLGGTSHYNDAQVSLSGGSNNTSYLVGAGYHKETTVFPGDFSNRRGSLHFNLNSSSTDQKIHFSLSTNYSVNDNQILQTDFTNLALNLAPDAPALYNPDGSLNWALRSPGGFGSWTNPLAILNNRYKSKTDNLITNAILSYKILPGLEVKSSFGYTNTQTNDVLLNPASAIDPSFWSLYGTDLRTSSFVYNKVHAWIIEPQVTYSRHISKGFLSLLVGTTIQQNQSEGLRVNAQGFNSDLVIEDLKSASITSIGNTTNATYKYNAVFGRASYNWNEKYLLNLTARRDGTSRFGPDKQFHNFGAFGAGWVFSKESFIENNLKFLSFGKLRGSYGTTGSDAVGDYTFLDLYSPTGLAPVPYGGTTGLQLTRLFTPDLAWEETKKLEAGLELGFLKDRIILTASHYINKSSNQLVGYALPSVAGFQSVTKNLDALVENKGWEFVLNTVNLNTKNLRWTSSFNIFWNRNKLVSIDSGMINYKQYVGRSLSSYYLYKFGGVDPATGLYQFIDIHGNPVTTPTANDLSVLIDPNPKFSGGFQNSIQYKGVQLDFFFQFVKRTGLIYLYNSRQPGSWNASSGNQPVTVLERWQKPGDVTNIQKFSLTNAAFFPFNSAKQSDQLYSDDISFIRLKNVSISWQLPKPWQHAAHLQDCKIYIQGQNLLTWTKYKGLDPEGSPASLPPLRVITMGIQLVL